ncbi:hypothetical protein MMC27_004183 [Xylographa pallens]|nr:hypothetical protein [Xylographa pallens]
MLSSSSSASNGASTTNGKIPNNPAGTTSTSAVPKDSTIFRTKQASSSWRNFEDALKGISKYSRIYSNIEGALDRQSALELETGTKDKLISSLQLTNEAQVQQFEKRYSIWDKEKNCLDLKITNMKAEAAAQAEGILNEQKDAYTRKAREIQEELEAEKVTTATLTEELLKASTRMERTEMELSLGNRRLRDWEGHVSMLKDMDIKALSDYARWDNITRPLAVRLCLPPSNSPAAQYFRAAAALHVITSRLCLNIFKPCYIPEFGQASKTVDKILAHQLNASAERENITRAMLLSAYPPSDVEEWISRIIQTTSEDVLSLLSPISRDKESLRTEVMTLFGEAVDVWKVAQHSKKLVEASLTDEDFDDWPWSCLEEFTSGVVPAKEQPVPHHIDVLSLFPRVFIPENSVIVHPGVILWPNQNTIMAAEQEVREKSAVRRLRSGRQGSVSGGTRRLSILNDGRTGVRAEGNPFLDRQRSQVQGSQAVSMSRGDG